MKNLQVLSRFRKIIKLHKKIDSIVFNPENEKIKTKFRNFSNDIQQADTYISKLEMLTKNSLPNSTAKYWDSYYKNNENDDLVEDWYCDSSIVKIFLPDVEFQSVLVIGNGISKLPLDLAKDEAFEKSTILSTDISQNSCDKMNQINDNNSVQFICEDVLDLSFKEKFDLVLDKGLVDTFWKSESEMNISDLKKVEMNIWKCLKDEGVWVVFSVYDLAEIEFLNIESKNRWKRIEDTEFETDNEITIKVYRLFK
eukprot:gene427-6840_t